MIVLAKIILEIVALIFAALLGRNTVENPKAAGRDRVYGLFCLFGALIAGIVGACL